MSQARKSKSRLLFLEESTYGVRPSVTPGDSYQVHFEGGETLDSKKPLVKNPHVTSSREYGRGVPDKVEASGDVALKMNAGSHGIILKGMLGGYSVTGAGPYTHVFKPGDLPSFTIEKGFTDIAKYFEFNGARCGSFSLTMNPAGFLEVSTSWMMKGEADTSPGTSSMDSAPTVLTDNPFGTAKANTVIKEGGSNIATVNAMTIDCDNELDGDQYTIANQGRRASLPYDRLNVKGKLTAFFEDLVLYNKAVSGTKSSIQLVVQHGTGAGSAGNEKLTVDLAEVYYFPSVPKIGQNGGVLAELEFEAVVETGTESIKFTLLNSVATYA